MDGCGAEPRTRLPMAFCVCPRLHRPVEVWRGGTSRATSTRLKAQCRVAVDVFHTCHISLSVGPVENDLIHLQI